MVDDNDDDDVAVFDTGFTGDRVRGLAIGTGADF